MKSKIENKLRLKVAQEVQCSKEIISVKPNQGLFNYRCHENAIEFARLNPDHKVIETIYIENNSWPVLHYVNQAPDGSYLDNTLGYKTEFYEYYFIREIHPDDFKSMGWLFDHTVDYWSNKYLKWWHRLLGISRLV